MNPTDLLAHTTGADLASWRPLAIVAIVFAGVTAALFAAGPSASTGPAIARVVARIPNAMSRATRVPGGGWAMCAIGMGLLSLLSAGAGFYSDVAWHIDLGRDEVLFTPPHTMIVVGLAGLAAAAVVGIAFASVTHADVALRWRGVRLPWSMLAMGFLGATALSGFPLDELWHRMYGVDVTMWSPTHLLLIVGATLAPIAWLLALGEARVRREHGPLAKAARVLVSWLVLSGLAASLGEFEFGVPQFQQLYHPVLVAMVSAFGFTCARLILGPGRSLLVAAFALALRASDVRGGPGGDGHVTVRSAALWISGAIAVELAAWMITTRRPARFAAGAGFAVATLGLAGEWVWNAGAHQPWAAALLPDAVIVAAVGAIGAALLAAGLASAVTRAAPPSARTLAVGGLLVIAALAIPLPRRTGNVTADVALQPSGDSAVVRVRLDPPDAARDARWFQTISWQGGGLVVAGMVASGEGRYVSDRAVPVSGRWKTLVRLHRGAELMSVPVYLPADAEIGEPEIPATDRTASFEPEGRYLLREAHAGPAWFGVLAYATIGLIAAGWAAVLAVGATQIAGRTTTQTKPESRPTQAARRGYD